MGDFHNNSLATLDKVQIDTRISAKLKAFDPQLSQDYDKLGAVALDIARGEIPRAFKEFRETVQSILRNASEGKTTYPPTTEPEEATK